MPLFNTRNRGLNENAALAGLAGDASSDNQLNARIQPGLNMPAGEMMGLRRQINPTKIRSGLIDDTVAQASQRAREADQRNSHMLDYARLALENNRAGFRDQLALRNQQFDEQRAAQMQANVDRGYDRQTANDAWTRENQSERTINDAANAEQRVNQAGLRAQQGQQNAVMQYGLKYDPASVLAYQQSGNPTALKPTPPPVKPGKPVDTSGAHEALLNQDGYDTSKFYMDKKPATSANLTQQGKQFHDTVNSLKQKNPNLSDEDARTQAAKVAGVSRSADWLKKANDHLAKLAGSTNPDDIKMAEYLKAQGATPPQPSIFNRLVNNVGAGLSTD